MAKVFRLCVTIIYTRNPQSSLQRTRQSIFLDLWAMQVLNSATIAQKWPKTVYKQCGCVPIKLYLQNPVVGQTWLIGHS